MSHTEDFGVASQGLNRAEINVKPQVNQEHPRAEAEQSHYRKPSIRRAIGDNFPSIVAHPQEGFRAVRRTVRQRRANSASQQASIEDDHVPILAPAPPQGTGDERLKHELEKKRKYPPAEEFMRHPVDALKTLARDQGGDDFAENVAKSEVSHGADVRLLRQVDKIENAADEAKSTEVAKLLQLKHARQDAFVRWTIDRHVRCAKQLRHTNSTLQQPQSRMAFREWIDYTQQYIQEEFARSAERYGEEADEKSEPDERLLASSTERVVVVSAAFQSFVMQIRSISEWKDPRVSATYMVLYFTFLLYSQITRMAILFVLGTVVYRRYHIPGLDQMRGAVVHSEDQDEQVNTLTQLILQYGTRGWVDEAIKEAGPVLLRFTEETADLLEKIQNFYEWRDPSRTRITLFKLFGMWIFITLTPTELLVKFIFLSMGVFFFILAPLGTRYPQLRMLTSPVVWLMWKIPTHAEWAIARLQKEAAASLQGDGGDGSPQTGGKSKTSSTGIIGTYDCTDGRLTVTTRSVSFSPDKSAETGWCMDYEELDSFRKVQQSTHTRTLRGLSFKSGSDVHSVHGLELRDEIFSQILGYSRMRWKRVE
ncbi:uncharacterized protein AB675_2286 [Cyphellophora attinorum]|uniref:Uncharacterized protein n=1 Tax=Cyphellophora attinorum TaxID=1664694 RepID=A0A0N1P251_9EURO|nr:uncharacterized protein AB675_2286 [Phialophora attinorum]KPI44925.1 hypothetical protein AB675_2286 [Phialophora attinorum]